MNSIQVKITEILSSAGATGEILLSVPPKPEMGDMAFACFAMAKAAGKKPNEVAEELAQTIQQQKNDFVADVKAFGPYVNFFLQGASVASHVLSEITDTFGKHTDGENKRVIVEFGCPNPLKVFHLGHLKNLITGESIVRILENSAYEVIRVNYQGDVGMHIARALWGIFDWKEEFDAIEDKSVEEKVAFLGKAYAHGAKHSEKGEKEKEEVLAFNAKVYNHDSSIEEVYMKARQWSLDYFDTIYQKLGSHFDKLYFESEVWERGVELVNAFLPKGVFKESEGAVIFEGSKHGLHDRVFLNSKGFPTYEAKDLGLAESRYNEFHPDQIIHVVGKEQTEYFKVVFKALESVVPESKGKGYHLPGGYLQLKGEKKMSSRTGNVIAGDELVQIVTQKVQDIMEAGDHAGDEEVVRKVTNAVLKYSMLKVDARSDIGFDMEESVSVSGDSGPYLLYIVARIKSILKKADTEMKKVVVPEEVGAEEKALLLSLAAYPVATKTALTQLDPSLIARYLFDLAQTFNSFYHSSPVLDADDVTKSFRISLISAVEQVMTDGLNLLGIETVEQM